ncbi:right-handed parallel beta-helix repeat-containing protein [Verrucomicrobium sp. BvORR106]|uniref:right-handed parallel beta-helix repeat-containing protein n=1 Tax=Verrucomicrobium sp. BvORR106 TaxID=1403819 RepID=UPI0005711B55|nr:right-handed parallel beta-helix repeat-containing protein [Verrucomicrobium sp. BvORR106]
MRSAFPALTLIFSLLLAAHALGGDTWYVAPEPAGDDQAAGTLDQPFASLQRAQEAASAGDTVNIRGGTYVMTESMIARKRRIFARVIALTKSGSRGKPITYQAYNGERPVFDFRAVKPAGQRVSGFYVSGDWIKLKGIEVVGVQVTIKGHTQSICIESQGSHNVFEQLSLHDGQAIGIYHVDGSDNLFLNCDAWNNWDNTSGNLLGGNVDGFGCHPTPGSTGNVFRGCRAWFNSDDGYDCLGASEAVIFENCWAAYNGFSPQFKSLADGNGFKAGGYGSMPPEHLPKRIPRHIVRYCLSVGNKQSGFYANHHPGGGDWFHNTAYRNGANFNMLGRLADNQTDVDGFGHRLINNVSYGSNRDLIRVDLANCELRGNTFTTGLKLRSRDFQSLDADEFTLPRQQDGSLPNIRFLKPSAKSVLLKAGADFGPDVPLGKADLGAFSH